MLLTSDCSSCTTYEFDLTGFINADSTAAPENSWIIETYVESGGTDYVIDSIDSGVLATPYIREGTLTGLDVARTGDTVGSTMILTFDLTLENGLDSTDKILLSFPS